MAVNKSFFYLTDSRRPPAEPKVASGLSQKNPSGTIYEIFSVLNAFFYKNINAHYKTHTFLCHYAKKPVQMTKNTYMSLKFHKCPKFF